MSKKVLILKNVGATLFQQPDDKRPSALELGRTLFGGRGTGPLNRLAAAAGLAGKGAALGGTAVQTAHQMQGGNLFAPLSAGYTYEGLDPSGKFLAGRVKAGQEGAQNYQNQQNQVGVRAKGPARFNVPLPGQAKPARPSFMDKPKGPANVRPSFMPPLPTTPQNNPFNPQQPLDTSIFTQPTPTHTSTAPVPGMNNVHSVGTSYRDATSHVYGNQIPMQPMPTQTSVQQPQQQVNQLDPPQMAYLLAQQQQPQQQPQQFHPGDTVEWTDKNKTVKSYIKNLYDEFGGYLYKMTPHEAGQFAVYTLFTLRK